MAGIWLNEDNSHYFFKRGEKASDPDYIRDFIMQYKDTNVERMILNGNSQKTSFRTNAGEAIYENVSWEQIDMEKRHSFVTWSKAVKDLVEKGIDIYGEWIGILREIGIEPWMSMRMNDVHNADNPDDPMHSLFYKNHLEYRRAMHRDEKWEDRQLNYLEEDVRRYHFAILEEYFEKYDFDGIELDWMRFGNHFPVGYEDAGREVLADFMGKARELADRYENIRGHRIGIGARVPVSPENAFDMGMDGVGWALAGYVDYLAPSPFWHTSQADIPVERWKRQVAGTGCKIAPCLEICLRQYAFPKCRNEFQFNSMETIRGAVRSFIDRGADAIYTFNYMDMQGFAYDDRGYRIIITETGNEKLMNGKRRRHVLTFNDRRPEGAVSDEILPCALKKDVFSGFRIHTGNAVKKEKRLVLLAFLDLKDLGADDARVYVNGVPCEMVGAYEPGNPRPVDTLYAWTVPERACKDGYQVIEVVPEVDGMVLDWVEIVVD